MARILFGPLVTSVKGSIAGVTFQQNTSGQIIRRRPQLSKASTNKQTTAHSDLQRLLFEWQQITESQRDDWNTYASVYTKTNKFGEVKTLTGMNWFTSVNWWRLALGESILSDPGTRILPTDPPAFAMLISASDLLIQFLESHDYVNYPVAVWASLPTKKSTLSINQIRKLITIITSAPANPLNITTEYETATGLNWNPSVDFPNANLFVCLESVAKQTGITSPMLCTKNTTPIDTGEDALYYYRKTPQVVF